MYWKKHSLKTSGHARPEASPRINSEKSTRLGLGSERSERATSIFKDPEEKAFAGPREAAGLAWALVVSEANVARRFSRMKKAGRRTKMEN